MFEGKRQSFGTALFYLRKREMSLKRYIRTYYPKYDWGVIRYFFYDNPIQARVIIEDFRRSNYEKIEIVFRLFNATQGTLMYVIGAKGSGKTCTGFYFAEEQHLKYPWEKIYYIGRKFNKEVLPDWCHWKEKLQDVPNNSFGILDELGIQASARAFATKDNKELSQVLQLARQKKIRLVVLTQDARLGEVNVWRLRDIVVWKKSNTYDLQDRESRASASNKFWNKVRNMMAPRKKNQCLFEYPAERRFIHFTHEPPECWCDDLSEIYRDATFKDSREDIGKDYRKIPSQKKSKISQKIKIPKKILIG